MPLSQDFQRFVAALFLFYLMKRPVDPMSQTKEVNFRYL